MKILQINKYLKIVGGAETYMFQLSSALRNQGIEVKFWGMADKENIVQDFPEWQADNIDFSNQSIQSKISSSLNTIYSKNNRRKLAKVLDSFQPDIVHLHNYNFQLTPSILIEIKKRGIKVVQTIHDSQMVCPYHRLYNFQHNKVCTKCVTGSFVNCIKDRCFDGSVLKSTLGAAESFFYHTQGYYDKYIDIFISPSNFLASLISLKINKQIEIIPNFTKSQPQDFSNDITEDYYLYYGRISEEKGILELIEIFNKTQLKLLIIGKGPLEELISNKVKNISNIEFIGAKYDKDLFGFVKKAKYVIQSSKGFENCPMTIIESFSLGVPVIGSDHSGFKDLIDDGNTGFLLNFNEESDAVSRLVEIDSLSVMGLKENVNHYYKHYLSEEVHLKKISLVYNRLLEKKTC